MTYQALTVILEKNTHYAEIEALINAIQQLRGVERVETDQLAQVEIDNPAQEGQLTMLASEAVLAKEWNRPEEDEAWADL